MVDSDWLYSRGSKQRFDREALVYFTVLQGCRYCTLPICRVLPGLLGGKEPPPPSLFLYLPIGE